MPNKSEVHVLGPVSKPRETSKKIFKRAKEDAVLLDLSAGQLITPHRLKEQLEAERVLPEHIQWINGQEFADRCAKKSRQEYLEWLANHPNKKSEKGQSIKDLFTYRNEVSLWWFTSVAEKKAGNSLRWLFYMIDVVGRVKQKVNRANVWNIWVSEKHVGRALRARCPGCAHVYNGKGQRIDLEVESVLGKINRIAKSTYFLIRQSIEVILNKYDYSEGRYEEDEMWIDDDGPIVLIQTYFPHSWTTSSTEESNEDINQLDRYFGESPWSLRKHGCNVAWMPTISGRKDREEWGRLMADHPMPEVSNKMEASWRIIFKAIYNVWRWMVTYIYFFEIKNKKIDWSYKGVDVKFYLRESIRKAVQGGISTLQKIEEYRAVNRAIDPDVVLYRNEFYTGGRCVSAAFDDTTTLIGVQHGLLGNEHTVYHFHGTEVNSSVSVPKDHISNCPVPNYFASFGDQFVDMFENWKGYPAERVWPVGSLRHDSFTDLCCLGEEYNKKKNIRVGLGLPIKTPVLLLCTGAKDQVAPWSSMLFEAIQMLNHECFLAIKLHQYHGGEPQVRSAAANAKFDDYGVYSEKIYSLLAVSDVVIASESTVLLEAGLFETPSIALKPPSSYQNYDFGELADAVSTVQELREGLRRALDGELKPKGVSDHLRNADGKKATKRLLDYISKVDAEEV